MTAHPIAPFAALTNGVLVNSAPQYDGPRILSFSSHDLPIDYVDNCWLRVAMDSTLLRLFLRSGPASDLVARLLDKVDDRKWYVVNEEEF